MEKVFNFNGIGNNNFNNSYNNKHLSPAKMLLFQNKRVITFLFKLCLDELEGMKDENLISEEYFRKQRKFILDSANSGIRDFETELDKFIIKFKQ